MSAFTDLLHTIGSKLVHHSETQLTEFHSQVEAVETELLAQVEKLIDAKLSPNPAAPVEPTDDAVAPLRGDK